MATFGVGSAMVKRTTRVTVVSSERTVMGLPTTPPPTSPWLAEARLADRPEVRIASSVVYFAVRSPGASPLPAARFPVRLAVDPSPQPALPLVDHRTTERQNGRTAMSGSWRFLCIKSSNRGAGKEGRTPDLLRPNQRWVRVVDGCFQGLKMVTGNR